MDDFVKAHLEKMEKKIVANGGWYTGPDSEEDPAIFEPPTLADIDQTWNPFMKTAVSMVRLWAERLKRVPNASMLLLGNVGTGKTMIARIIQGAFALRSESGEILGFDATFMKSNNLILALTPSENPESGLLSVPTVRRVIASHSKCLIIDELGTEQKIPFVAKENQMEEYRNRLYQIIDYCYDPQNKTPLIITSNLGEEALKKRVGMRCWDRLNEMAPRISKFESYILNFSDVPSYREKRANRKI